ncbi:MAG TPA: OmpA family protein, partial [Polyangiaceae bacterium]
MAAGSAVPAHVAPERFSSRRAFALCLVVGFLDLAVIDLGVGPAAIAAAAVAEPASATLETTAAQAPAPSTAALPAALAEAPCDPETVVIYFASDSAELDDTARAQVGELASRCTAVEAALDGHADPRGTDPYNRTLSQRRAAAVAQELRAHGVALRAVTA